MNCHERAELTPLYLSGELEEERAAAFGAHLKSCAECIGELQHQARLDARLHDVLLAEDVNATKVDQRVREMIASRAASQPAYRDESRRWILATAGIAAAFALLVLAGHRFLLGKQVAQVYADAARDDQMEVVQLQPRHWYSDPAQISVLAQKVGVPQSALQALQRGPYRLERAKICFLDKHLFLHVVFSDGQRDLSMFLRQRDAMSVQGSADEMMNGKLVQTADIGGEHVALFETPQLIVMVATTQSSDAASHLVAFAASKL